MSDRYASRNKGQYGYSSTYRQNGYNKDSNTNNRNSYGRQNPLGNSLNPPPRKKAIKPVPLSSLKSEHADTVNILSSSGWGQKKSDDKAATRAGDEGPIDGLKPWVYRGVPGLNQPEKASRNGETDGKIKRPSNPANAAMLPSYMKLPPSDEPPKENVERQPLAEEAQRKVPPKHRHPSPPPLHRHQSPPPLHRHPSPPPRDDSEGRIPPREDLVQGKRPPRHRTPPPVLIPSKRDRETREQSPHSSEKENIELPPEPKEQDSFNWAEDDKIDAMQSWADDRPVKWDEKIDFSDEDKGNVKADSQGHLPQKLAPSSGPNHRRNVHDGAAEPDSTDRYDNRYEDERYSNRHDRQYSNNGRSQYSKPTKFVPGRPVHRGFYDDHKRKIHLGELEKAGHSDRHPSSTRRDIFSRDDSQKGPANSRRLRKASDPRRQTSESNDREPEQFQNFEQIELEEPEPIQPSKKRVITVKRETKIRDFTNEEKGEDDLEDKVKDEQDKDDKGKHVRGWKKGAEGVEEPKQREPHHHSRGRLPTADGSKQSRLDKDNAEREHGNHSKNSNVWEKRKKEIVNKHENGRDGSQDSKNKEVYIPSENDRKKTLGETNPGDRKKESGPQGRRDQGDRDDRRNKRREPREPRQSRGEPKGERPERSEKPDRGERRKGHKDQDSREDRPKKHQREDQPAKRDSKSKSEHRNSKPDIVEDPDVVEVPPAPEVRLEPAPIPKENIWAKRIETRQQVAEPKFDHQEQVERTVKNKRDRDTRSTREPQQREGQRRGQKAPQDRSSGQRLNSRDQDRDSRDSGSALRNFRDRERRAPEQEHRQQSQGHPERNERKRSDENPREKRVKEKKPRKSEFTKPSGEGHVEHKRVKSDNHSNRLSSYDDDNKSDRRAPRDRPERGFDRPERDGQTAGRARRGGATRGTDRKTERKRREKPSRNDRFKSNDFRTAYEFPKPSSDIKEVETRHVDVIRGGMSFRGLMKQRVLNRGSHSFATSESKSDDFSDQGGDDSVPTTNDRSVVSDTEEVPQRAEVTVEKVTVTEHNEEQKFQSSNPGNPYPSQRSPNKYDFPDQDPNLDTPLIFINPEEKDKQPVAIQPVVQPFVPTPLAPFHPPVVHHQTQFEHEVNPKPVNLDVVGPGPESVKWTHTHRAWHAAENQLQSIMPSSVGNMPPNGLTSNVPTSWQPPATGIAGHSQQTWALPLNREPEPWKSQTKPDPMVNVNNQVDEVPSQMQGMQPTAASSMNAQVSTTQMQNFTRPANPYSQNLDNGSNFNGNFMTNTTNPLAANYNQPLMSNQNSFANYQQPMYQNQLQIAASAQLQANAFFSNENALYNSPSNSNFSDIYQNRTDMFQDQPSSLGNQMYPFNFQDSNSVMGIQRPPSNNTMQNIFSQQPMAAAGYRTNSGFSGLINQQARQNGLPNSFPQMQAFGKSSSPSPGLAKNIMPPSGGFEQMHPNLGPNFGPLSQVLQFRGRNRPSSITPPHPQQRHKPKNDFNAFGQAKGYPDSGFNGFDHKDSLKQQQQFMAFEDKSQLNQQFLRQGIDNNFQKSAFPTFNGQSFHHQPRPRGHQKQHHQSYTNPFEKKGIIGNEMTIKNPGQKGTQLQGQPGNPRNNQKSGKTMGNMENYKQTMAKERQELLALTKNFSSNSIDNDPGRHNVHESVPKSDPMSGTPSGEPNHVGEQNPETIVSLTSTDRKRLTLADTAPKRPGEVRRIITNNS